MKWKHFKEKSVKITENYVRNVAESKGPDIKHKDQAMRLLGMGVQMTDMGAKPVYICIRIRIIFMFSISDSFVKILKT